MKSKIKLFVLMFLFLSVSVYAQAGDSLTDQQVKRVQECKRLLEVVDSASLQRTVRELEQSDDPEMNLQILEAKANTYAEIVLDKKVEGLKNKKWLYSMVGMNMAFMQFGGSGGGKGRDVDLNRLIQKKLREHLPADIFEHPGFIQSIEDLNDASPN